MCEISLNPGQSYYACNDVSWLYERPLCYKSLLFTGGFRFPHIGQAVEGSVEELSVQEFQRKCNLSWGLLAYQLVKMQHIACINFTYLRKPQRFQNDRQVAMIKWNARHSGQLTVEVSRVNRSIQCKGYHNTFWSWRRKKRFLLQPSWIQLLENNKHSYFHWLNGTNLSWKPWTAVGSIVCLSPYTCEHVPASITSVYPVSKTTEIRCSPCQMYCGPTL